MNSEQLTQLAGQPFNVRWFGARGNGSTDDTAAFQAAIDAALTAGITANSGSPCVLIPAGCYRIDAHLGNQYCAAGRLVLGSNRGGKLHIRGEGQARLTSLIDSFVDNSNNFLLAVWGQGYSDVLIENLTFQRFAGFPGKLQKAVAIAAMGTRTMVRNCTFIDFPQAIYFCGATAPKVEGCRFLYTDGLACARGPGDGAEPAVGIRCDDWGQPCSDVEVSGCHWRGTERMDAQATYPMDGFLWGTAKSWSVHHNYVRRATAEGICLLPSGDNDRSNCAIVESNIVDCEQPAAFDAAKRGFVRMGIRVDENNALVRGNFISKSRSPISINNLDQSANAPQPRSGGVIADNVIVFDPADCVQVGASVLYGVALQNRAAVAVTGNQIDFPAGTTGDQSKGLPTVGVMLTNCRDVEVSGNRVLCASPPAAGQDVPAVRLAGGADGVVVGANIFRNMTKDVARDPGVTGAVQVQANTLFQTPQAT